MEEVVHKLSHEGQIDADQVMKGWHGVLARGDSMCHGLNKR